MKRKILLPTDFSENAWHAINYAVELYKDEVCDFYILNVFSATGNIMESLMNLEPGSGLYETKKKNSEEGLNETLQELILNDKSDPKHSFKTISVFNNPIEAIKNLVEQKDIEMIVMGTKGETSSSEAAFGSTAIYVMEKVRNCPVMVIPQNADLAMPKEIVFPTGYKTHYKKRELSYLINIAKKCSATIAVLHVSQNKELSKKQQESRELLEEIFEDINYEIHNLSYASIETAVSIFIQSRKSGMLAFINKKHEFFGSILTNPMVKNITFHVNVPILTLHDLRN
ncbi:MAG: universal stress protein [Winogradskyella sp.]|uniref:universal stress protein n=1 Tax=Winogradskyella sp. TaxID=1883156 RepID=UPI000F411350|nr:universal stress protein [Winogradskyella sp.]RNC87751.1 MAG: universal stress protein [Winogradskyella sp.]